MRKHLQIFIPVIVAVAIGSITFAFAQTSEDVPQAGGRPHKGFGSPGPEAFDPRMFDALRLTDAQKEQAEAIHVNARDLAKENESKLRAADEQLRMMVESGAFTEEAALPLIKAKSDAMSQVELTRLKADAAILNILTADQKAKLSEIRAKRPPHPPAGEFRPGR